MTDSPKLDVPVSPSPPVPRTMVLGYFGRTAGPTRVRRITAVGLLILAVLDTGLAGTLALTLRGPVLHCISIELEVHTWISPSVRVAPTWIDWVHAIEAACLEYLVPLLLLLCCALGAFFLIIATVGVYRGRRWACRIALAPAVVHLLLFILCSAAMLALVIFGLVDDGGLPSWRTVLMLALGLLSGLLALLMIDLCAFLRWIARMPDANPPPRKFV